MPERQVEFLEHLANLLHYTGRWEESLSTGKRAMALAQEHGNALSLVRAAASVTATLRFSGRHEEERQLLEELEKNPLVQAVTGHTRTLVQAQMLLNRLDLFRDQGRVEEAIRRFDEMIGALETLPRPELPPLAMSCHARGLLLWLCGAYPEAIRSLRRSMDLLTRLGDVFAEAITSGILGLVYWSMGSLDAAEAAIRHSIEANERLGAYWRLVPEVGNLGLVCLSRGQLPQALEQIERQITMARHIGARYELCRGIGNRGMIKLLLGRCTEAWPDLEEDWKFTQQSGQRQSVGFGLAILSMYHAGMGRHEEARRLAGAGPGDGPADSLGRPGGHCPTRPGRTGAAPGKGRAAAAIAGTGTRPAQTGRGRLPALAGRPGRRPRGAGPALG